MWLVILILIVIGVHIFRKLFKIPKLSHLIMVTGGVKTGKSVLSVYFAIKQWRKNHFAWRVRKALSKVFKRFKDEEEPLIYSNIPLNCKYVPLTRDLVMREKRFNYKSVVFVDEASLFADSMMYKDEDVNEKLKYFNKLIAHMTKGGALVYNSQSPADLHHSIKRSIQSYFYIHHSFKVPFFVVCYVRELLYSAEEQGIVNSFNDDVESSGLRRVIIPSRYFRMYDRYAFSALTDKLPKVDMTVDGVKLDDLKARNVLTIKKEK